MEWYPWHHPHLGTWRGARVVKGDRQLCRKRNQEGQPGGGKVSSSVENGARGGFFHRARPTGVEKSLD